jgi:predicted dehydrogenase
MHRRQFVAEVSRHALSAAALTVALNSGQSRAGATKDRIKVGQIGTSHAHAAGKMETMRKFADDWDVVGIVEPDADRRAAMASNPVYRDVPLLTEEQLLNTPGLAAVAIETEVRDLVPTARRCVAAGMHVHVDKPGGESLADFAALLDEATSQGRTVQMGYMLRYNPAVQFCLRAVRQGWLGDVFEAHTVMSKKVDAGTRRQLAEYRGGTMFELGCHVIDALVAVMGKPDRVTPFTRRTRPELDDLADNQLAVFEYPRATATVRSSVVEPHGGDRRQFTICGNEGVIDIRPLEPGTLRLALEKPRDGYRAGYQDVELPPLDGRYDGDFIDLAAIIRGEKPSDFPPAHDLAVQECVLRASGVL